MHQDTSTFSEMASDQDGSALCLPDPDVRAASPAAGLQGPWLVLAQGVWMFLALSAIVLFGLAVPALYTQHLTPDDAVQAGLVELGLSPGMYAAYWVVLHTVFAAVYIGSAAILILKKSNEPHTLFVSLFLLLLGSINGGTAAPLLEVHPGLSVLINFLFSITMVSLVMFLFVFPNGRFVPSCLHTPAGVWAITVLLVWLIPGLIVNASSPPDWFFLLFVCGLLVAGGAQIYRYLCVSTPSERKQMRLVVYATTIAIAGQLVAVLLGELVPELKQPGIPALLLDLLNVTLIALSFLLIPLAICVAILRYRLWDIDLIISRSLVYGTLTTSIIATYVLVVSGLGMLLSTRGSLFVSLFCTALVAILFQPLRERLQQAANRLIYGKRDDPYAVISRLSRRLGSTFAFEEMLPTIVETVKDALRLPYVGITLRQDDTFRIAAESGHKMEPLVVMPLEYHHETIGQLLLAPRSHSEPFHLSERRLLEDLAQQAGVALYSVRLTAELQRSRERLVTAREEERRRLRRDLHDGLGPQLAALTLKVETVRSRLAHDPLADALLDELTWQMQMAVANIRHLVHALRPPILDELGLVQALRQVTAQHNHQQASGLQVVFDAPESLPPLSAAVEVAVYHITREALTNVIRHSAARTCVIRFIREAETFCLEISDDGRGLDQKRGTGVGLSSMRERAEELGGCWTIEAHPAGGTRIKAQFPCRAAALAAKEPGQIQ